MKYSHEYEYVRVFLHPGIKRRIVFILQPEIKSEVHLVETVLGLVDLVGA
jgi:hypothetical protein